MNIELFSSLAQFIFETVSISNIWKWSKHKILKLESKKAFFDNKYKIAKIVGNNIHFQISIQMKK